jgi:hypothetical protein
MNTSHLQTNLGYWTMKLVSGETGTLGMVILFPDPVVPFLSTNSTPLLM